MIAHTEEFVGSLWDCHRSKAQAFLEEVPMHGASRPRILIADDHALIAEAFTKLLATAFDVIATVYDGRTLVETAQRLQPDVILADIGMPLLNGLEAAQRIKRKLPNVKVIYVTVNHDPDVVAEAFRRGASGYLPKTASVAELVSAIYQALNGDFYLSPQLQLVAPSSRTQQASPQPLLTERQVDVLQLLAEGRSMKEAAAVLNLTTRTVAYHKYRIMGNLHLRNDAEVVQYAMRHHVVFG
jgi:DNA-binding NarL/FixJ family response regulator